MIATLTLNPCVDKTLYIRGFYYGGMNRVERHRADVSGKGINVSVALKQLGYDACTFGIRYENGQEILERGMKRYGIEYKSVLVPGTLRENMKVMDEEKLITTELNEKGEYVPKEKLLELEALMESYMDQISVFVVTGSVPEGVPATYYQKLIKMASARNIRTILDAEGDLFLEGLKAKPYLIKPNLFEFKSAFGIHGDNLDDFIAVCRRLICDGIHVICLTMGEKGALIVNSSEAYLCRPSHMEVRSTQGAGDSLVAGICAAIVEDGGEKENLEKMLRYGVAAAQGSLIREGTLLCKKEDFERFLGDLKIVKLNEK